MSINKEHMTGKNQKEENNTVEKQKDNKVLNTSENFHKLKKKTFTRSDKSYQLRKIINGMLGILFKREQNCRSKIVYDCLLIQKA